MSLFSFQDIITSLTGIMIFFLLLLALNILNTAEAKQEESPLYQEIAYQKERKKLQEKQIAELSGLLKDYPARDYMLQRQHHHQRERGSRQANHTDLQKEPGT